MDKVKTIIKKKLEIQNYMWSNIPVMLIIVLLHVLEYREDEPSYSLNKSDLIIFTIILLVASFTSCLVMFLFRYSITIINCKNTVQVLNRLNKCCFETIINYNNM